MKENLMKVLSKIKEMWQKLTPKVRSIIKGTAAIAAVLIVLLVGVTIFQQSQFRVIYEGMESAEATQVYAALQDLGIESQIDKSGNLQVASSQYDRALMELAQQNFPKSTLSYDTFLNTSFTATEYDKKQALRFQLEQNIAYTLMHGTDGVQNAIVMLNLPEESNYVWEQSTQEGGSAMVTMTMRAGYELSAARAAAVKKLVSSSQYNMNAEDVTVIDGSTGLEVEGTLDGEGNNTYSLERLDFERQVAKGIEDKVKRLLTATYGADGVVAVASVVLDYDKMITEKYQQNPEEFGKEDDSTGVITKQEIDYSTTGNVPASGIAGEEDNTDTPGYAAEDGNVDDELRDYHKLTEYESSYIKQQIEKGEALLSEASIAVMVRDPSGNLSAQRVVELTDMVSKATNIAASSISVTNLATQTTPVGGDEIGEFVWQDVYYLYLAIPVALLLVFLVVMLLLRRHRKKKKSAAEQESEQLISSLQAEIEDRKRQLADAAKKEVSPGDGAIVQEVRDFAKDNPEITANLIRGWLKEDM